MSRKIEQAREEKAAADELGVSVSPALISDLVREVDTLTLRGLRKAVLFHRLRFEPPLLQHYTSLGLARPPPPPLPPHQGMVERPREDMGRPFEPFFAAQDTVGGLPWLAEDLTGVAEVRKREEGERGVGGAEERRCLNAQTTRDERGRKGAEGETRHGKKNSTSISRTRTETPKRRDVDQHRTIAACCKDPVVASFLLL